VKFTVRKSFLFYLLVVGILSSLEASVGMIAALFVHEASHYLVIRLLREPVDSVEIAPFGGVMTYKSGKSASKGIKGAAIAIAGPLGNYAILLALNVLPKNIGEEFIRRAMIANLSMIVINMIPALPLDGGALFFDLGFYLFEAAALIRILCAAGVMTGTVICFLGIYGWLRWRIANLSLLVVGVYLVYAALRSRESMIIQNLYTVVQEKLELNTIPKRMRIYRISHNIRLWDLLRFIGHSQASGFFVEYQSGGAQYLSEADACRAMLEQPMRTVGEIVENNVKKKRILP